MKSRIFALVYFAFCCYSVSAQNNITKTAGVNYTNGVPTFNPSQKTGSEYAIDTTTGRFYQLHRTSAVSGYWLLLGQGIDTIGSHGAPTYAPTRNISWFAINLGDSLYRYSGSGFLWNCLNCGGGGGGGTANNGVSDNEGGGIFRLGNRYMASPDAPFTMDRSLNIDGRVWFIGDLSDSTLLVVEGSTDRVGIGTPTPGQKLDLLGNFRLATTAADATNKFGYTVTRHYTNAEEDVMGIYLSSTSTQNEMRIGGGNSSFNASTRIGFYTAADQVTLTGAERMRVHPDGRISIGNTTSAARLYVRGEGATSATYSMIVTNSGVSTASAPIAVRDDNRVGLGTNAPTRSVDVAGALRFQANLYDNQDNSIVAQSAVGVTSNRDFTLLNSTYGRFMLSSKNFSFTTGTHPALGQYLFYVNGEAYTSAAVPPPIYFRGYDAKAGSGVHGGDFIIDLPNGDGAGAQGRVGIGNTAPTQALHLTGNIRVTGAYYDSNNDPGLSTEILSSTATGTDWVTKPVSATILTANNALTVTGTNVQWGGTLVQNTTVDQQTFYQLHKDGRKEFARYEINPFVDVNVTGTVDITGKGLAPSMNPAPSEDNILTVRGHDGTSTYYANALFMGVYPTAIDGTWIQSRSESAYTTKYLLNINPRGGKVAIGRDPESDDPDAHVTISQAVTGSTITGILLHLENGEGNKAAMSFGVGTDVIKGEAGYYDGADAMRIGNRNAQATSSIRFAIGGETTDKVVMIPAGTGFGTAVTTNIKSTIQDEGSLGLKTTTAPSGDLTLDATHCVVMKNSGSAGCTYTLPDPDAVVGRWYWIMNHSSQTITLSRNVTTATGGVTFNTIGAGEWAMMTAFNGNGWRGHKQVSL